MVPAFGNNRRKEKSISIESLAHRAALNSDSLALSQTLAEAEAPWDPVLCMVCLFTICLLMQLPYSILLGDRGTHT